jgi:predicted nucleic acid-binding protein
MMKSDASPRVVLDASAAVALLADTGPAGVWVKNCVSGAMLAAPDIMPYEAANTLRRHAIAGKLDASAATLFHEDLNAMPFDLFPYLALAGRMWRLRDNLTIYDAAYVALAEYLGVPLVTLDTRLAGAAGMCCAVLAYRPAS